MTLELSVLPERLAVCRLEPGAEVPGWAAGGSFSSVTRTPAELSLVCRESSVPESVRAERGWRALAVAGPLDFALTGVIASLAGPLAEDGVPIFVLSTFDTDYLLVKEDRLAAAIVTLRRAGQSVSGEA